MPQMPRGAALPSSRLRVASHLLESTTIVRGESSGESLVLTSPKSREATAYVQNDRFPSISPREP